ncbi:FkbM family methyltransferase [Candidatus Woesearchaeota archaeon]|nr:FkbM family methyltransferase [Candidatus Woesearchaeota archaeon]
MTGSIKLSTLTLGLDAIAKIANWPDYFSDLFDMTSKKEIVYKTREGQKFNVRAKTTDRGILTTVVLQDEYKVNKMRLPKDATVIDIGGQIGIFSTFVARKAAKVYTFEPTPENFEMIKKNIKLNKLENTILPFNLAVGDKVGTLKIYLSQNNTGGHSIYGDGDYVEVKTIPLKDVFEQNNIKTCDLLKMDIEGAEYMVLYNLPDKYYKRIKRIRMEVHNMDDKKNNDKSLIEFLKKKGYNVFYQDYRLFANRIE